MAITFDTNSGALGSATSGNTTMGSLTDGLAMVFTDSDSDTVTAVTVNSISGTLVQNGQPTGGNWTSLWKVAIGDVSGSVAWTITGTHNQASISSYGGVDQTNPIQRSAENTVSSQNSVSVTQTPTTDGTWAVCVTGKNGVCATDGLTNITSRYDTASANTMRIGDSNGTLTKDVAFTQTVTSSGCTQNHYLAQAILQTAAATSLSISVSDQLNITESVSLTRISNISVSDQLNITESVTLTNIKNISVFDQLNITENTNLTLVSNISVSDQINITENVLLIGTEVYISVSDQIDLTENTTQFLHAFFLSVSDSVTVSESVTSLLISNISVSDSLTLTENVTLTQVLNISVSESVDITESVERTLIVTLSVSDQINITESVTRVISDPKRGLAIMRGKDQQWPFAMDEGTGRVVMRGKDQQYPLGMDDSTIL